MAFDLRSGPATVLAAGEATTFFGHPLRWRLELPEGPFEVELRFVDDPEVAGVVVRSEPPARPGEALRMCVVNANDDAGRGSATPALLGQVGDDLLFLHFRAFRFGTTPDHTVHFTYYRVAADAVGWRALPPSEP